MGQPRLPDGPSEKPPRLAPYQVRVVRLICDGLSEKEVATRLGTTPATINQYVHRIYRALGIASRFELLKWALRNQGEIGELAII